MAKAIVTKVVSTKGSVNWKDALKGVLMAAISGGLIVLYEGMQSGMFPDMEGLKKAGAFAATAGLAYIIKQFGSGPGKDEAVG